MSLALRFVKDGVIHAVLHSTIPQSFSLFLPSSLFLPADEQPHSHTLAPSDVRLMLNTSRLAKHRLVVNIALLIETT